MRLSDAGYCTLQYNAEALKAAARDSAWACHTIMRELDVDTIAVTGKSGMSVVFAAQMLDPFNFMVVRKESDQSHGCRIEGKAGHRVKRYAILDDFVSSGDTVRNIVNTIRERCTNNHEAPPSLELVVVYDSNVGRDDVVRAGGKSTVPVIRARTINSTGFDYERTRQSIAAQ